MDLKSAVEVTEKAQIKVEEIYKKEVPEGDKCLRLKVLEGGCSGLSYKMEFDLKKDDDYSYELSFTEVVVDPNSFFFLNGIVLDYEDGLTGKGFVFNNPNAAGTCNCGDSFKV